MVSFIKNKGAHAFKFNHFLVNQIKHTPWCRNQNINTILQLGDLLVLLHTTIQSKGFNAGMPCQLGKYFANLLRQFAGGCKHNTFDTIRAFTALKLMNLINHRNSKSGSFTCTCLGDRQHIFTCHNGWNGFKLNIGRSLKTQFTQVAFDIFGDVVLLKLHNCLTNGGAC